MKKIFDANKSFSLLVLAFFAVFISFSIYTLLSGMLSFAELDAWDGKTIAEEFTSGNGTEENPYVIHSAEEFMYFKSLIEGDTFSSYQDKYYVLDSNINLGGFEITPIGVEIEKEEFVPVSQEEVVEETTEEKSEEVMDSSEAVEEVPQEMEAKLVKEERIFKGHLDGQGYTIRNFKIYEASVLEKTPYYALFSKVEEGTIQRINIASYRIEIPEDKEGVISGLVGSIPTGTIENVTLTDFNLKVHHEDDVVGVLAGKSEKVEISNIYVNGEINHVKDGFIRYYEEGKATTIISQLKYDGIMEDEDVENLYRVDHEEITLKDEVIDYEDLLTSLNENLEDPYYWSYEEGVFTFSTHELDVEEVPSDAQGFNFSLDDSPAITLHASGLDSSNKAVYVNDLTADYNHYMGLNYTEIRNTNGTLPDGSNQGLYSNTNLATVYIRYNSADINDSTVYGSVSVSEDYRDFYYYKRIPVVDGKVEFDLIDNPWANRPSGRAFNGWVTDFTGAVVSLDTDTYVRHVSIPVSNISNPISITFYSSWTTATTVTTTNNLGNLKSMTMTAVDVGYEDVSVYHVSGHVDRNRNYPNSNTLYGFDGYPIVANSTCTRNGGCDYLIKNSTSTYSSTTTYYKIEPAAEAGNPATITIITPTRYPIGYYPNGGVAAGYFKYVTGVTENVYNSSGTKVTSCDNGCYQLLQYVDGAIDSATTYYYLPTRDTNIFAPSSTSDINASDISTSRPMTITGINGRTDNSANRTIYLNRDWSISNDLRIEHITFYSSSTDTEISNISTGGSEILGNFKNLKIGRGLLQYSESSYYWGTTTYLTAANFVGGTNSGTSGVQKYTTIVESGFYQNASGVGYNGATTQRVNAQVTLGCDFDRIANDNDNLIVYYSYAGSWASYLYNTDESDNNTFDYPAIHTTVKSGRFGDNQQDYAAGIYTGGRGAGTHYAMRAATIEGGWIHCFIGGPVSSSSRANKNDIIMNVKGGTINFIFGGAGASDTRGNRIINVTGGTINYSVLGGSNAYLYSSGTTDPYGKVEGDTLVYVGGNVTVGTADDTMYNISAGNVFGAGNGRQGELDVGSVRNSNVIIGSTADIKGDVYGGGNFGAVGGNLAGTSTYDGNTGGGSSQQGVSGAYKDSTSDQNIRYFGSSPDNYIIFNNETYRIVGLFNNVSTSDGNKDLVRIVKNTRYGTNTTWSNDYVNIGNNNRDYPNYFVRNDAAATKSNIYTVLNTTYYGSMNSDRNYIQSVNWGMGALDSATDNNVLSFYTKERGSTPGSSYSTTSYNFKVGLLYPSDFGFATNNQECLTTNLGSFAGTCTAENWIDSMITYNAWTITPSTYYEDINTRANRTYNSYYVFYIGTAGNIYRNGVGYYSGGSYTYRPYSAYPSFYLKEDVEIVSGTGTQADPYRIGSGTSLNSILEDLVKEEEVIPDDYEPVEDDGNYQEATDYQARTHVQILGGTIDGSVYGAGNRNGSGNKVGNNIALSKVTIDIGGGTIKESVYGGSNEMGTVYGDVLINATNGTITKSIYGGGKGGYSSAAAPGTYVSRDVDVNIGSDATTSLTIGQNVYGGSAFGTVNGIQQNEEANSHHVRVTVNKGTITGSVFGGGEGDTSYNPNEYGNVYVHVNGGNMTKVFGGNDSRGEPSNVDIVYLNGGTIGDAFGGGNNTGQTYSDIRLQGSTVTGNVYGGSNASGDVGSSHVTVSSGSATEVFGGNNLGGESGANHVSVTGGTISTAIYGGGKQAESSATSVSISGCQVPEVYGGGKNAGVGTNTHVDLSNATATKVFGGSNASGDVPVSNVHAAGSTITSVYGGNNSGGSTETTNVRLETSTVTNVFGGGDNATSTTSNVTIESGSITNLYGGGNEAGVTTTNVNINGGTITTGFGGSNKTGDVTEANVKIAGGTTGSLYGANNLGGSVDHTVITSTGGSVSNLYGGGNKAVVGETSLTLDGLTAGTIFGGGNEAAVSRDVTFAISNSNVTGHVYGGGNAAGVHGNVDLTMDTVTVAGNVYGGGNEGIVQHDTNVKITDSSITSNVFAGGNGATAVVHGNSTVTIDGTTVVGNSTTTAPAAGCVFGSGNAASTGQDGTSGVATVNIVGGEIYGNVYGGPKMAVVYGETFTNIGTNAVNISGLKEDDIWIHGTVFGGGESNASGSTTYDYTFISVTEGIEVNIDGGGYDDHNHDFIINGSIFGSGNASSSAGDSYINIKNLGSMAKPNRAISIQRANRLVIDASAIELMGARDRTNEIQEFEYSLNLIDYMIIKNNTSLFLQHNANLLKEIYSGVDVNGSLVKATVDIDDDTKTVTRNVDNRIYMVPGENLHIAVNAFATAYGRVNGMTFYGMYTSGDSNNYRLGLYDPQYDYGDTGNAGLEIVGGSYAVGLRNANHDITKDGFYTNTLDSTSYTEIITKYINPSPIGETGYRWIIGFEAINYTVPLTISKYSTLGTYELSMIDFAQGNSTFTVLGFDSTGLEDGLALVDPSDVPRIASTEEEANSVLGLAMKVETQEWTSSGTTKFYSRDGGDFDGGDEYSTDSRQVAPSAMFYAYHAKNFSRTGDLGECVITIQVAIPKNVIEFDIKFVTITVELKGRSHDDGAYYDASITYDKKYEMPAATDVFITNQSQFTSYFSLTEYFENFAAVYGQNNTNYRVLTVTNPLPVGTFITMLDVGASDARPEYYYYKITQSVYDASVQEWENLGEVAYRLSNFIKMDSTTTSNTYNDQAANLLYYDTASNLVDEEFIFIIDMKDCATTGVHLDNKISFELRNADGWGVINVVSGRDPLMVYSTFDSSNVVLQQTLTDTDSYLYYNVADEFTYSTEVLYNQTENRQSIIDTNYEFSSMGLNVEFFDRTGEPVSSSLLVGTNISIGNKEYYADGEGVFRIKLASKVSNITKNAKVVIGRNLPAGVYTMRYTLFASEDGLHNSTYQNSVYEEYTVTVVSSSSYIAVECEDETKLVYGETGLNHAGENINTYLVKYVSELNNPNFRVEVYKRNVDTIDTTVYQSVPFSSLFTNSYTVVSGNEVSLPITEEDEESFDFELQSNLTSGTYRISFKLYDNNQLIDEDIKNVIVQKKID